VTVGAVAIPLPSEPAEAARWEASREQALPAAANHIRLGFEIDPGFVMAIPGALLPIRAVRGEAITTANLDPSHLPLLLLQMQPSRRGACRG
jgi:hypothetical protein